MTPMERLVFEAAFDVAVERLTTLYAGHQIFIFGPEGDPMWSHYQPDEHELKVLKLATRHLEQHEGKPAPLTIGGSTGLYTAFVLDGQHTLYAVVLTRKSRRSPAEARVSRASRPEKPAATSSRSARRRSGPFVGRRGAAPPTKRSRSDEAQRFPDS